MDMNQNATPVTEITRIDGHAFEKISDGFYRAVEPYEVNIRNWMMDESHRGYQALTNNYRQGKTAWIHYISTDSRGTDPLERILFSSKKTDDIGYVEGIPSGLMAGELYV
jgi:hypothetical protein